MKKRIECRVSGRVQMVMYRDFATRSAKRLGITGEVWNEADGTVVAIAEGEEEILRGYIHELEKGSLLSRVEAVEVSWHEALGAYKQFTICYK